MGESGGKAPGNDLKRARDRVGVKGAECVNPSSLTRASARLRLLVRAFGVRGDVFWLVECGVIEVPCLPWCPSFSLMSFTDRMGGLKEEEEGEEAVASMSLLRFFGVEGSGGSGLLLSIPCSAPELEGATSESMSL